MLTVVWILYPVVFAIGPEGVRAVGTDATSWAILVLDVLAKVIYAFYAANNLEKAWRETSATSVNAAEYAVATDRRA